MLLLRSLLFIGLAGLSVGIVEGLPRPRQKTKGGLWRGLGQTRCLRPPALRAGGLGQVSPRQTGLELWRRVVVAQESERPPPILGGEDLVSGSLKKIGEEFTTALFIIDDKNHAHGRSNGWRVITVPAFNMRK